MRCFEIVRAGNVFIERNFFPYTGIFGLPHFYIGTKTTGCNDDAFARHEIDVFTIMLTQNTNHLACLILNEFHSLSIGEYFHFIRIGFNELFQHADIAITTSFGTMTTWIQATDNHSYLRPESKSFAFQPMHRCRSFFNQFLHQLRIVFVVTASHRVLKMSVDAVVDVLTILSFGINRVVSAPGNYCGAT